GGSSRLPGQVEAAGGTGRAARRLGVFTGGGRSPRLDVVAPQGVLLAQVELPAADDRVGPARGGAVGGLGAPCWLVAGRAGLDRRPPAVVVAEVEPAVGVGQRGRAAARALVLARLALPQPLARLPHGAIRLAAVVGVAVGVVADDDDAPVFVGQLGVEVVHLDLHAPLVGAEGEQGGPLPVAGGGEHLVAQDDGRGDVRRVPAEGVVVPQLLAVLGGNPEGPVGRQLHVLPDPGRVGDDDGGIARGGAQGGLPDHRPRLLVQGHDRGFRTAGGADELVAIDQRGLGVVPAPGAAAEVLPEVLAPLLLALARLQADEVAELADGVEP